MSEMLVKSLMPAMNYASSPNITNKVRYEYIRLKKLNGGSSVLFDLKD